jgi:hypothetical protein
MLEMRKKHTDDHTTNFLPFKVSHFMHMNGTMKSLCVNGQITGTTFKSNF